MTFLLDENFPHCGIVVIALRQPTRQEILDRLGWFLDNVSLPIDNRAFVLRDRTYRVTPAG